MSYSYKWIGNDIVFSFIGEITFDDLDQANSEIYRDSRFDLMNYAIFDFLRVTHFSLNEEEMEVISALDQSIARWNRNLRLALVGTDHDNVEEMILRYLKLMGNNEWDIEYFDHLESAIDWCLK
jgi:hypothetical protein